jgi:prophage regulatory protein
MRLFMKYSPSFQDLLGNRSPAKSSLYCATLLRNVTYAKGDPHMSTTNAEQLLKLPETIGDKKHGIAGYIPMSKSKWYAGIKTGIFPAPLRIGSGSFWRLSDIQKVIEKATV